MGFEPTGGGSSFNRQFGILPPSYRAAIIRYNKQTAVIKPTITYHRAGVIKSYASRNNCANNEVLVSTEKRAQPLTVCLVILYRLKPSCHREVCASGCSVKQPIKYDMTFQSSAKIPRKAKSA